MFASRIIYASALMLILWIQEVSAEGALSIFLKQCKGDTDVFNIHYASVSCYGECAWGGRGTFTATYTIGKNLTSSIAEVELSVLSVPGWNGTVDMCNWGQTFSFKSVSVLHNNSLLKLPLLNNPNFALITNITLLDFPFQHEILIL
jgi:hypothetical protein